MTREREDGPDDRAAGGGGDPPHRAATEADPAYDATTPARTDPAHHAATQREAEPRHRGAEPRHRGADPARHTPPRAHPDAHTHAPAPAPGSPPRRAEALLARLLRPADRDAVLGDLAEEHRQVARTRGDRAARRWYRREVARSLLPALRARWTGARADRRAGAPNGRPREEDGSMATALGVWAGEARAAGRALLRTPGFTWTAVLTLGLGIGASTAIFAVVDSIVLRPLAYPDADRLVWLDHPVPAMGEGTRWGLSVAGFVHFQDEMESLEELGAGFLTTRTLTGDDRPERLSTALVSASLLRVLGARAETGRLFGEADDAPGAAPVVLVSHRLWTERFGSDPALVGSTLRLDGEPVPVLGVLSRGFDLPAADVDLWLPSRFDREAEAQNSHYVQAVGLLAAGANPASARAELAGLTARLPRLFPVAYSPSFMAWSGFTADVRPLREVVVGDADRALWILLAGVALLLLVACANVANLFLVRTEGRLRAVALRRALGADRGVLAAGFLGEGLLLAGAAGLLGLALARGSLDVLVALAPPGLPRLDEVGIGPASLAVTAGLVVASGLVFGAFPLLRSRRCAPAQALAAAGHRSTRSVGARALRDGLVVAQVALALVLVTASGLLLASFARLAAVDPGFQSAGVTTFDLSLPRARYPDAEAVHGAWRGVLDRLAAVPGVAAAGAVDALPIAGGDRCISVTVEDPSTAEGVGRGCPQVRFAAPGYFETMGIALESGRTFEHRDNDAGTAPLVVSRAMADALWPGADPLGRGVRLWGEGYYRVVGVVADVRDDGLDRPPPGIVYFPIVAAPGESMPPLQAMSFVVRQAGAVDVVGEVRRVVREVDPELPVAALRPMDQVVARSMVRTTFTLLLLGAAGGLGLLLGVVGMYAVVAYAVSQRTAELGIRIALGAGAGRVRAMVLGHAGVLAAAGVALGLALSLAGTRVLDSLLFGVSATDPLTLGGASALLLGVSLAAAWLPARRATRVDPVTALRRD